MQNTQPIHECNTEKFGALNGVKAQSVRAQFCRTGSYFGVKPRRLANGRLLWPAVTATATDEVEVAE